MVKNMFLSVYKRFLCCRKNKYYELFLSFVLNIAIFAITLLFYRFVYFENDDQVMNFIAAGAYGSNSEYLVFINIILGYLLKFLYLINPEVNWYVFVMYTTMFLGWVIIYSVLLERIKRNKSLFYGLFSIFIVYLFTSFSYRYLQFTLISTISIVAGFLLIMNTWEKLKLKRVLLGVLFIVWGSFIRYDSLFLVGLFFGIYTLWQYVAVLINNKGKLFSTNVKKQFIISCVMLLPIILSGGFKLVDTLIYKSDPVWKQYTLYNVARSNILDYPTKMPDDSSMYYRGLVYGGEYFDTEVLSLSKMQDLAAYRVFNKLSILNVFIAGKSILKDNLKNPYLKDYFIFPIASMLIFLIFSIKKKSVLILNLYGISSFLILYYIGRPIYFRVLYGILLVVVIWLCYSYIPGIFVKNIDSGIFGKSKYFVMMDILVCFCFCLFFFKKVMPNLKAGLVDKRDNSFYAKENTNVYNKNYYDFEKITKDKENLYVATLLYSYLSFLGSGNVFNISLKQEVKKDFFVNTVFLGGWDVFSKRTFETMAKYGVANPYRSLVEKDNVYLIATSVECPVSLIYYFRKEYKLETKCDLIQTQGSYSVFKFRKK